MKNWFRWLFRYCMDCGIKLDKTYNRGDVCKKCFDDFNGMILEELWRNPYACDLCGKIEPCPTQEHIYPPDFTFVWCKECMQKDEKVRDKVIEAAIKAYWEYRKR